MHCAHCAHRLRKHLRLQEAWVAQCAEYQQAMWQYKKDLRQWRSNNVDVDLTTPPGSPNSPTYKPPASPSPTETGGRAAKSKNRRAAKSKNRRAAKSKNRRAAKSKKRKPGEDKGSKKRKKRKTGRVNVHEVYGRDPVPAGFDAPCRWIPSSRKNAVATYAGKTWLGVGYDKKRWVYRATINSKTILRSERVTDCLNKIATWVWHNRREEVPKECLPYISKTNA